jgi:flavin reductase (DIM6/NTAB) family NADH-FMN oxidoreductase RutF
MTISPAGLASCGTDPLRAVFGQYATGVCVVTAISADGSPAGMTINSLTSVSLDPPLVLWCLQRSSARFSVFAGAGWFGVSILAAHQEHLARRFAARHPSPFRGLAWSPGRHGVPLLPGTLAHLVCRAVQQADGGDHLIIIGSPDDGGVAGGRPPLAFFGGRYHAALPAAGPTRPTMLPARRSAG